MKLNKKRNISFGKIFTIFFCITTLCLAITMADLFSSLITVGGFSFTAEDVKFTGFDLYAVCTSSHETRVQSEENAELCKIQGGAGYVYLDENSFNIIASIYENEADAEKVKKNMAEQRPSSKIIKIAIPEICLNSNLSGKEKEILTNSILTFKNTYKKLYDLSVSLDTALINEVNAKLAINSLAGDISKTQNNFNTIFSNNTSSNLISIKLKMQELAEAINNLVEENSTIPLTSLIKSTYCKCVFLYKNLSEELL